MKINFSINFNPHEKISYSFDSRNGRDSVSKEDKCLIHERVDKILEVITND